MSSFFKHHVRSALGGVLCLLLAVMLVACGGGDGSDEGATDEPVEDAAAALSEDLTIPPVPGAGPSGDRDGEHEGDSDGGFDRGAAGGASGVTGQSRAAMGTPENAGAISAATLDKVAAALRVIGTDRGVAASERGPVWLGVYAAGHGVFSGWADGPWGGAVERLVEQAGAAVTDAAVDPEAWVVSYVIEPEAVDLMDAGALSKENRGEYGVELALGSRAVRMAPIDLITQGADYADVAARFVKQVRVSQPDVDPLSLRVTRFRAIEGVAVVDAEGAVRSSELWRGMRPVRMADVNQANVQRLARSLRDWLVTNTRPNGEIRYLVHPHTRRESTRQNIIRQWLATWGLARWVATHPDDGEAAGALERNMAFNRVSWHRREKLGPKEERFPGDPERLAWYEYDGKAKLGAVGTAMLAYLALPERTGQQQNILAELDAMQTHLWIGEGERRGRFRTFYKPKNRDDNHNFYPGEAMLAWAHYQRVAPTEQRRAMLDASFDYYYRWHLDPENRNPAFIPWHTQAYVEMWRQQPDERLVEAVFVMNDWLIETMQPWEMQEPDVIQGRFYNPEFPQFGVPHVSSTSVYIEGLIHAWDLAEKVGDEQRAERYRVAILRGLRSVMQMLYDDPLELWWVADPERVRGGLRTSVTRTEIRVDNVGHMLNGVLSILEKFDDDDYALPEAGDAPRPPRE